MTEKSTSDLPSFTADGVLPPGDYVLRLKDLRNSILVRGTGDQIQYPNWDASWRAKLVDNLAVLVRQLWKVGVSSIFIDGSFVEDKEHQSG